MERLAPLILETFDGARVRRASRGEFGVTGYGEDESHDGVGDEVAVTVDYFDLDEGEIVVGIAEHDAVCPEPNFRGHTNGGQSLAADFLAMGVGNSGQRAGLVRNLEFSGDLFIRSP